MAPDSTYDKLSYGNPAKSGILTVFERITVPRVVVRILALVRIKFHFCFALRKACSSLWNTESGKTLFTNQL